MGMIFTHTTNRYESSTLTIPSKTITHEIDGDDLNLSEICDALTDFLRGCGYVFDGCLTIEPTDYPYSSLEDGRSDFNDDDYGADSVCQGDSDSETVNTNPSSQMEFNFEQPKQEGGNGI